eukprot:2769815-Alexandrium_andersonii.AAC.1
MSASLVGSEMCIRDRAAALCRLQLDVRACPEGFRVAGASGDVLRAVLSACLLYTSDAADDM